MHRNRVCVASVPNVRANRDIERVVRNDSGDITTDSREISRVGAHEPTEKRIGMDAPTIIKLLNDGGLVTILGLILMGIVVAYRNVTKAMFNEQNGLVPTFAKSVESNRESNRMNAEANKTNAESIERMSRAFDRQSRVTQLLAEKLGMSSVTKVMGDDEANRA